MLILCWRSHLQPSTYTHVGHKRQASKSIPGQSIITRISCQFDATQTHWSSRDGEGSWSGRLAPWSAEFECLTLTFLSKVYPRTEGPSVFYLRGNAQWAQAWEHPLGPPPGSPPICHREMSPEWQILHVPRSWHSWKQGKQNDRLAFWAFSAGRKQGDG